MSATYNARIIGKLSRLSDTLRSLGYSKESGAINGIIGRINTWKEGKEWNPDNALSLTDADNVLEELINKFNLSASSFEKDKSKMKERPTPEVEKEEEEEVAQDEGKVDEAISEMISEIEEMFS